MLQSLPLVEPHSIVEAVTLTAVIGLGKVWDHYRARPRATQLDTIANDVRDLKAYVVGPDGQNGLRSEVRDIKERIGAMEERERDRLHGKYAK